MIKGLIEVGKNVEIDKYCNLHAGNTKDAMITIGDNTLIAPFVSIIARNHGFRRRYNLIINQPFENGTVKIGQDCWIGANSVILPGVTIGNGAVVGAGSVVTKDIPPYEVWAGNPAKKIGERK